MLTRQHNYVSLLRNNPELEALLKQLRGFEKELDVARMRMHPYLSKPWKSKSRKRQMATLTFCLTIGGGLSYFLMQILKVELLIAALCGAALCLVLLLMATFCVCFKASRV